jgi:predicted dithiol-disulfide oxidoreductase (DUF899 family)
MSLPEVVSRDEWLVARKALLEREKQVTRQRDAVAAERRRLPMVRIDADYVFEGPSGRVGLLDMFEGRDQLFMQHFMFDPSWEEGCPSCTATADELAGAELDHLAIRGTTYVAVSRAPLDKIERYRADRGWTFPWYSSFGSDFNYDFGVTLDESVAPVEYNYRSKAEYERRGAVVYTEGDSVENPGLSCFLRVRDEVFHTYSTFARGAEAIGGSYYVLDLTALGRQEEWEEPKGRAESVRENIPNFAT